MFRRWSMALMLVGLLAWWGSAAPLAAPAPAASPSASPNPMAEVYARLLKEPKLLDFKPDQQRFDAVFDKVRQVHVDDPTEKELMDGVFAEVRLLGGVSKVSTAAIDSLPHDRSSAAKIAAALGGQINPGILWFAMLTGMMNGTHDQWTVYMTPYYFKSLSSTLSGDEMQGIGVYMDEDSNTHVPIILQTIEGSPADQAGLLSGDEIVRINGNLTHGMSMEAVYKALKGGDKSDTIYITYHRPGETGEHLTSFQRAIFSMPSATHQMIGKDIGYIRLYAFGLLTANRLKEAFDEFTQKGVKGVIVDVRNNGGGYANAAATICGYFLPPDSVVSLMVDRNGTRPHLRGGSINRIRLPVVLLVNEKSASASELTAACFKDYHIATLIGTHTYGKGCQQEVFSQEDHSAYKITDCYFTGPKGTKINKIGIEPDIKVDMEQRWVGHKDRDIQLVRAIEFLNGKH